MAQGSGRQTGSLEISWDVLDSCNGFTFDMGGTVLKVVYIDKHDWIEPAKRTKGSNGKLCVACFSHAEVEDGTAFKFIKENVHMKKDSENPLHYGTGFWVSVNGDKINKGLGISMKCIEETDCFTSALKYMLKNTPRKDLVDQCIPSEEIKACREENENYLELFKSVPLGCTIYNKDIDSFAPWFNEELANPDEPFTTDKDIYPCVMAMCGSGWGVLILKEDTYEIQNISSRSGRMWLGLGSLLTGGNDYTELMDLAQKGDNSKVDACMNELMDDAKNPTEDDNSAYKQFVDSMTEQKQRNRVAFFFGLAQNKKIDDYKKEDLAASLLTALVSDLVSIALNGAKLAKAKHVFFSGGFAQHPYVRKLIYREWKYMDCCSRLYNHLEKTECHFLKNGQHYGAIGALLNHKLGFNKDNK